MRDTVSKSKQLDPVWKRMAENIGVTLRGWKYTVFMVIVYNIHVWLQDHCCVLDSIIGWNSQIGVWTRIEGTPNDPNPNKPFAKIETTQTFTNDGKLNPSITVIGKYFIYGPKCALTYNVWWLRNLTFEVISFSFSTYLLENI